MTEKEFILKVQYLHNTCGIPYSVIGKKLNVTGQYISMMINNRKPISEKILSNAAECNIFINDICGGDNNERTKSETYNY